MPSLYKFDISEQKLIDNPCLSVMTGAWILAGIIRQQGYNWNAVGAYNAGSSPDRKNTRRLYAQRIWPHYQRLHKAKMAMPR